MVPIVALAPVLVIVVFSTNIVFFTIAFILMARTKQTARKSMGGRAPVKMKQTKTAESFRHFMTSQQAVSHQASGDGPQKVSYINHENVFYSFGFDTKMNREESWSQLSEFDPRFVLSRRRNPWDGKSEMWLCAALASKFDGPGIKEFGRPTLDIVLCVDVSGSMSMSRSGWDGTKLDVAKRALIAVTENLREGDRVSLVTFNHGASLVFPLSPWNAGSNATLVNEIQGLSAGGGTSLSLGMATATSALEAAASQPGDDAGGMATGGGGAGSGRSRRIIFVTDLQSSYGSSGDVENLLDIMHTNANACIWSSVMGVGVDLSTDVVARVSRTKGCKYSSVDNGEEFSKLLKEEFDYDVTPIAFNIRIKLSAVPGTGSPTSTNSSSSSSSSACPLSTSPPPVTYEFEQGFGSAELADQSGPEVRLITEFPSAHTDEGESLGGVLLFKLRKQAGGVGGGPAVKNGVKRVKVEGGGGAAAAAGEGAASPRQRRGTSRGRQRLASIKEERPVEGEGGGGGATEEGLCSVRVETRYEDCTGEEHVLTQVVVLGEAEESGGGGGAQAGTGAGAAAGAGAGAGAGVGAVSEAEGSGHGRNDGGVGNAVEVYGCGAARKAVALTHFVNGQSRYVLQKDDPLEGAEGHAARCRQFKAFKQWLLGEMQALGDPSLLPCIGSGKSGRNVAYVEMLDKIIELEEAAASGAAAAIPGNNGGGSLASTATGFNQGRTVQQLRQEQAAFCRRQQEQRRKRTGGPPRGWVLCKGPKPPRNAAVATVVVRVGGPTVRVAGPVTRQQKRQQEEAETAKRNSKKRRSSRRSSAY